MGKITKAIIPAAGLGTRFLPITKAVPKPMLSVIDKPTIQYIVEELNSVGIKDVVIVVSSDSEVIKNHFGEIKSLEERLISDKKEELLNAYRETLKFNVQFAVQKVPNGLAGAILCAEPFIKGEPFALLLGDELLYAEGNDTPCIKRLCEVYEKTGKNVLSTMEVFGDDVKKYGNIGVKSEKDGIMQVNAIIEKPDITEALSNYAVIGRYVMSGKVMEMIKKLKPKNNELSFSDVLDELAKNGELVASCFEGERYDVGDKFGYLKANVELALKRKELKEETAEYIKELAKRI